MAFSDNLKEIAPDLSQIKTGTPALKIGENFVVNGIGGNYIPGGLKDMPFYKCASVGTGTWTGYLASVDSTTGVWSFAATATTGLTYDRITPVVGHVYDEECTFEVKNYKSGLPTDGLIFYLALADEIGDMDDTGNYAINKLSTNYAFTAKDGINCLKLDQYSRVLGPNMISTFPNSSEARFTISFWLASEGSAKNLGSGFQYTTGNSSSFAVGLEFSATETNYYASGSRSSVGSYDNTGMAHYVITYNGSHLRYYKSEQQIKEVQTTTPYGGYSTIYPGFLQDGYNGYISAFRIYNRVLDSAEIAALAAEFTPTAS